MSYFLVMQSSFRFLFLLYTEEILFWTVTIQRCCMVMAASSFIYLFITLLFTLVVNKTNTNLNVIFYSIPILPQYSANRNIFIKHFHGIAAIANIRGGGEYGEYWSIIWLYKEIILNFLITVNAGMNVEFEKESKMCLMTLSPLLNI